MAVRRKQFAGEKIFFNRDETHASLVPDVHGPAEFTLSAPAYPATTLPLPHPHVIRSRSAGSRKCRGCPNHAFPALASAVLPHIFFTATSEVAQAYLSEPTGTQPAVLCSKYSQGAFARIFIKGGRSGTLEPVMHLIRDLQAVITDLCRVATPCRNPLLSRRHPLHPARSDISRAPLQGP